MYHYHFEPMKKDCNENAINYSILKEYTEGTLPEEQKEQVISWFRDPDCKFKLEHCLKEIWKEADPDKYTSLTSPDVILDRIHHKINLLHPKKESLKGPVQDTGVIRLNTILKNLYRVAVILLLPIMAYLGWEVMDQKIWEKSQSDVVYNEFICPMGARSRFELPDGTSGWLNNGSRLKYPVKFRNDYREVELIGEAYFNVTHRKDRPFIINTDGLDVKVLGTRLNVNVYPDEKTQAFTLEEGYIELINRKDGQEITVLKMRPGQHAVYIQSADQPDTGYENQAVDPQNTIIVSEQSPDKVLKNNNAARARRIDALGGMIDIGFEETSQYTEWKNGKLVLRNDPMPVMLKRIERWYNVKFNITDERINQYRYWATFEEENLDQVLKMLSLTGPVTFEKQKREQLEDGTFKTQVIDIIMK